MPIRLFQYPLPTAEELPELNQFLASHRIAGVQREVVATAAGPLLLFIVDWVATDSATQSKGTSSRVDYREVFDDDDFARFSRLRDLRKEMAESDGVPVYAVFSNAQLAAMLTRNCRTIADLNLIEGIGKARVEKYGRAFVAALNETAPVPLPTAGNAKSDE